MNSAKPTLAKTGTMIAPRPLGATIRQHPLIQLPSNVLDRLSLLAGQIGVPLLRCGLAIVFVWFGVLKVVGRSDVFALVGVTVPIVNPQWFVPALGVVETLLGIGLLIPKARRVVLVGLCVHLTGTFLTFLDAPGWMFHGANPFLLTMDGEFVLKNFVLISAAVALLGLTGRRSASGGTAVPMPRTAPGSQD